MALFGRKKKEPQGTRQEDLDAFVAEQAAAFIAAAVKADGPSTRENFDYSRASLDVVDAELELFRQESPVLAEKSAVMAASYLFEVARREFGGRYLSGPQSDPFLLVIGEPGFQIGVMALSKVRGRVANGSEDDIGFFYDGIAPLVERRANATLV